MPNDALQSLAKKAKVSMDKAEKLWKKAKASAKEQGFDPDSDRYWAYVMGTVKKMLGVEAVDLLQVGFSPKVISEAVITKSSASFMKSRMRKVTDEIAKMDSEGADTNWKSVALNLRLFFNEYLSSLSSRTGLKALLLGESTYRSVPSIKSKIEEVDTPEDLINLYKECLPDVDSGYIKEAFSA